nr:hypothetical protein [Candidatus Sigynarchaeum springense]
MHPVVLFPVAMMVALAFTMVVKRGKRRSRRKTSGKDADATSCDSVHGHEHRCDVLPGMASLQKIPGDHGLGTGDEAATGNGTVAARMAELEAENARLKVENLKLKARGQKKAENLAGYRDGNKSVRMAARKRRQSKLAAPGAGIAANGDATAPRNKRTGKPKGKRGGGFKVPKKITREVEWRLTRCPRCGRLLESSRPVGKWHHVIIDV